MIQNMPKDPAMLLSFINLKLRDYYSSLEALCEDLQVEKKDICDQLALIGYEYDTQKNQFV